MENKIYFKDSFVKKMFKLIPKNLKKTWGFEIDDFSKIIGIVRYNNNNLESIYLVVKSVFIEENYIKFDYINNKFIFDSIYSHYDPITKQNVHPYEYRYDKDFNIIAIYKFHNKSDVNTGNYVLTIQYKNNEKIKEYYPYVGKFSVKIFEDLIKIKVLNLPHLISEIKTYNFLQNMWYRLIKLKNNDIKYSEITIDCLKVYGNDNLIYYWIK